MPAIASKLTVYISCDHCIAVYRAEQARRSEPAEGVFVCTACGVPVLQWAGTYDYENWESFDGNSHS